jgi:hypothetical protein
VTRVLLCAPLSQGHRVPVSRHRRPREWLELGPPGPWRAVIALHPAAPTRAALRLRDLVGIAELRTCHCLGFPGPATIVDVSASCPAMVEEFSRLVEASDHAPEFCVVTHGGTYEVHVGRIDNCPGPSATTGHADCCLTLPATLFGEALRDRIGGLVARRGLADRAGRPPPPARIFPAHLMPTPTEEVTA